MSTPTTFTTHRPPKTIESTKSSVKSLDKYYSKDFVNRYFKKLKITR